MPTRRQPFCRAPALLLAALAVLAGPAHAATAAEGLAELSLDSLLDMPVTGASRFVQRRSEASSSVTVITREEIVAFGWRTLAEVLRSVRGVAVSTDRTYHYLGVRGFLASGDYNTRVLLLVDGNRLNDALYDQASIGDEFPLDLDLVERIEFVPGQGSAVYGANALIGVVNVITREAPRQDRAELAAALGAAGTREVRASLRRPLGDGGLQLQVSRQLRRGDTLFDPAQVGVDGSDGYARGTDVTRRSALALRVDLGGFTASLIHGERFKGVPATIDLIYGDPRSHYVDTYSLLNVERSMDVGEATRLTARAFVGRYRFDGVYAVDYPPPTINVDLGVATWRGVEARLAWRGEHHRSVAGVELQDVPLLLQRNFDIDPAPAQYLDDRRRAWRASLYAEDQWAFTPGWELHLGARADHSRGQDAELSPRAALLWTPADALTLKAIHGRAFRPPNAYEAFYRVDAPAGYAVNPSLRAERVSGDELALDWRVAPHWRLSASLYRSEARQLLLLGYDAAADRYRFDNAAALDTRGGELEAEYAQGGVRYRASLGSAESRGSAPSYYPRRMAKGTAMWPLAADWTLALQAEAVSRRGSAPGYGLAHLSVNGSVGAGGPGLTLALRNLADHRAFDPGIDPVRQPVVPLPGREWRVEMRWPLAF